MFIRILSATGSDVKNISFSIKQEFSGTEFQKIALILFVFLLLR